MPKRPPGRPKAQSPKAIKVTVRLSEHQADVLQRLAKEGSLSAALRTCIAGYIATFGGERMLPDTPKALISRELRKARRATNPDADALMQASQLEEPAPHAPGLFSP